jgi:hypothetical protein
LLLEGLVALAAKLPHVAEARLAARGTLLAAA